MPIMKSSEVVCRASGLVPDGIRFNAKNDGDHLRCAYCGTEIHDGDLYAPFLTSGNFNDRISLADRDSSHICGWCVKVTEAYGLHHTGYGMFSLVDGVIPFAKSVEIAAGLLDPPTPPFVALQRASKNQHMAWRAPVNLSREMFMIRVGDVDLRVRRPLLLKARQAALRLGLRVDAELRGPMNRRTGKRDPYFRGSKLSYLPHPFNNAGFDPNFKKLEAPRPWAFHHAIDELLTEDQPQSREDYQLLKTLGLGELWALTFLLRTDAQANA